MHTFIKICTWMSLVLLSLCENRVLAQGTIIYDNGRFQARGFPDPEPWNPDEKNDEKMPGWAYWWEFGDGHYSTQESPLYTFNRSQAQRVRLFLMPRYSRSFPDSLSIVYTTPNYSSTRSGRGRTYAEAWEEARRTEGKHSGIQVFIDSNAGGFLVPNYSNRFAVHYRNTSTQAQEGYLIILFNESTPKDDEGKINWGTKGKNLLIEDGGELDSDKIPSGSIQSAGALNAYNGHTENYQSRYIYKVSLPPRGQARKYFSLMVNSFLKNYQAKSVRTVVSAFYIPNGQSFDPALHAYSYPLLLNEVRDPNRFKARPGRPYFRKTEGKPVKFRVDFENVGKGRAEDVHIRVDWPESLDPNIQIIKRYPKEDFCGECPPGYVDGVLSNEPCFQIDPYLLGQGQLNLRFYNIGLIGKKSEDIGRKKEAKGFVKFQAIPKKPDSKSKMRAYIHFSGADTLKAGTERLYWRKKQLALTASYLYDRGFSGGVQYQDLSMGTGFGWGASAAYSYINFVDNQIQAQINFPATQASLADIHLQQDFRMHALDLKGELMFSLGGIVSFTAGAGFSLPLSGTSDFSAQLFEGFLDGNSYFPRDEPTFTDQETLEFGLFKPGQETLSLLGNEIDPYQPFGGMTSLGIEVGKIGYVTVGARQDLRWYPTFFGDGCEYINTLTFFIRVPIVNLSPKR